MSAQTNSLRQDLLANPRHEVAVGRSLKVFGLALVGLGVVALIHRSVQHPLEPHEPDEQTLEQAEKVESSRHWISYTFVVDGNQANFVRAQFKLFDFDLDDPSKDDPDVGVVALTSNEMSYTESSSLKNLASKISEKLDVPIKYGAFSGGVKQSLSHTSGLTASQMVCIMDIQSSVSVVTSSPSTHSSRLRPGIEAHIQSSSAFDIVETYGEFFATQLTLGGTIRTVFQQTKTQSDSYSAFSADIHSDAVPMLSAAASGGSKISTSATGSLEKLYIQVGVLGGDTLVWLKATSDKDIKVLQQEWAKTFTEDTLFPIKMRLLGIWELIKEFNMTKAAEVQALIRRRWDEHSKDLDALDNLEPKPTQLHWMLAPREATCDKACVDAGAICSQEAFDSLGKDAVTAKKIFTEVGLGRVCVGNYELVQSSYFDSGDDVPNYNAYWDMCHYGNNDAKCSEYTNKWQSRLCPCLH